MLNTIRRYLPDVLVWSGVAVAIVMFVLGGLGISNPLSFIVFVVSGLATGSLLAALGFIVQDLLVIRESNRQLRNDIRSGLRAVVEQLERRSGD